MARRLSFLVSVCISLRQAASGPPSPAPRLFSTHPARRSSAVFALPFYLHFRRPPRILWFISIYIANTLIRAVCFPLTSGHLKGQVVARTFTERLGDQVAAWAMSIRPYRRRFRSRSFLTTPGCASIPYHYQELHGARSIRLIRLEPGAPCELVMADIDRAPAFLAISYRWGKQAKDFGLLLKGGGQIAIQHNVYRILQSLAPLTGCLHVWIDSICIDQTSDDEKVAQIPLMGDIYAKADRVVACLPDTAALRS